VREPTLKPGVHIVVPKMKTKWEPEERDETFVHGHGSYHRGCWTLRLPVRQGDLRYAVAPCKAPVYREYGSPEVDIMEDEKILSFKDLEPWRKGMELAERVHGATAAFPEEGEEIGSRMRDAAITIPAVVSEAFALESTEQLIAAVAPIAELETCVELAKRLEFLAEDLADDLAARVEGIALSIARVIEEIDPELDEDDDYPGRPRPEPGYHDREPRDSHRGTERYHHHEGHHRRGYRDRWDCDCEPPPRPRRRGYRDDWR